MYEFDKLIEAWVNEGSIPGAVLDISVGRRFRFTKAYGSYSDNNGIKPVTLDTVFDLASLSKVVATLPVALSLASEGRLSLEDPVQLYVPEFTHSSVTLRHLLQHTSGLPADLPYFPRAAKGRQVLRQILEAQLEAEPGSRVLYSDAGMILLGEAVQRITGERLDRLAKQRVFEPLGMTTAGYAPLRPELIERAAATEYVDGAYVIGEVHDEKCYHLGGVSGSAGLFGTSEDLIRYSKLWLEPEQPKHSLIAAPDYIRECFRAPIEARGLGWEVRDHSKLLPLSCGETWPVGSFGHTGFTGTSLWMNRELELTVVWLTNAVHLGRQTPIRTIRRILHDQIMTELKAEILV